VGEQKKRLEMALRECAELGVPETTDPWPAIRERVITQGTGGTRASGAQASEDRVADGPRRRLLVPDGPLGWVLAVLSVLIVGVGVYASSGLVRDLTRSGLPGPGAAGTGETTDLGRGDGGSGAVHDLFRSRVPGGGGEELDQSRTAGGAKVTLVRAYADANSVVVGFTVEDLEGGRRLGGHPVELQPGYQYGVRLTDESGTEYRLHSGGGQGSPGPNNIIEGPLANSVVFEPAGRIEPGGVRRFRLEIPLLEVPVTSPGQAEEAPEARPVGEPLIFAFEASVQPAPVVQVGQKATASGITLTLERVTDSPGQPEAVVCLEPRDGVRGWAPAGEDLAVGDLIPVAGEGDCLRVPLSRRLDDPSSVTVEQIELNPANDGEVIRGPWTFEFEAPGP